MAVSAAQCHDTALSHCWLYIASDSISGAHGWRGGAGGIHAGGRQEPDAHHKALALRTPRIRRRIMSHLHASTSWASEQLSKQLTRLAAGQLCGRHTRRPARQSRQATDFPSAAPADPAPAAPDVGDTALAPCLKNGALDCSAAPGAAPKPADSSKSANGEGTEGA